MLSRSEASRRRSRQTLRFAQGDTVKHLRYHEYEIHEGHNRVAEISKKWFRVADTYGVDIAPGTDEVLILAITVVIDMMTDEGK